MYLANAFSLGMLTSDATLTVTAVSAADVPPEAVSVVGHADTAAVFAHQLGRDVPMNRANLSLSVGDVVYVGQYTGPRLPEGATTLPEGASIRWLRVAVA
jgi:hypothetical protein